MNILAIDTSTDYLSLAILKDRKAMAKYHKKADMRHSVLLVPGIEKLLKKAKLKLKDIDCFAVSAGPGSFTGLRIGVTVVKGLARSLKKRIAAIPTLDVIAHNAKDFKGAICPVLDARKNKVYACMYRSDGRKVRRMSKYLLLSREELLKKTAGYGKVLFLGDYPIASGFTLKGGPVRRSHSRFYTFTGEGGWHPKAEIVGRIALENIGKKKFVRPEDLEPLYLYSRECDITGK